MQVNSLKRVNGPVNTLVEGPLLIIASIEQKIAQTPVESGEELVELIKVQSPLRLAY